MEIRGSDSVGGIELPCLSSFESHIKQLGKFNYLSICSRSNYKCIEEEYDLDYPIDDQEPNDAWEAEIASRAAFQIRGNTSH